MILIRSCEGFDELEACVQLQIETWGYDPSDVVPRKMYRVAQKVGGQVIGAFDTDLDGASAQGGPESLVAFLLAVPGLKAGGAGNGSSSTGCKTEPRAYLHSHMLAVREDYRNRGLGTELKLKQRLEALSRGIRLIEWTFDPLEIKNAHLNICKLGAIVCGYQVNFYGVSSSRLQGGLPTDRLVAEWHLDSPRVQAILEGCSRAAQAGPHRIEERILVPASIYDWKENNQERALAVQSENRYRFEQAFSQGLVVVGFKQDSEGNGIFELAQPTHQEQHCSSEELKNEN